jgi:hypothetical protein
MSETYVREKMSRPMMHPVGGQEPMANRQSAVSRAVGELNGEIDELRGTVDTLLKRLSPVIRSEPSCDQEKMSNGNCSPKACCDLSGRIDDAAGNVSQVRTMLNHVIDLLEV